MKFIIDVDTDGLTLGYPGSVSDEVTLRAWIRSALEEALHDAGMEHYATVQKDDPVLTPAWLRGRCWTCGEVENHGWHQKPKGFGPGVRPSDFHAFMPLPSPASALLTLLRLEEN